jgi:hypothetical protein
MPVYCNALQFSSYIKTLYRKVQAFIVYYLLFSRDFTASMYEVFLGSLSRLPDTYAALALRVSRCAIILALSKIPLLALSRRVNLELIYRSVDQTQLGRSTIQRRYLRMFGKPKTPLRFTFTSHDVSVNCKPRTSLKFLPASFYLSFQK